MRTFFNVWVTASLLLFYFGPIDWPGRYDILVALFVGTCIVAFNLGYISVSNPMSRRYSNYDVTGLLNHRWFAIGVMLIYALFSLMQMQAVTGQSLISAVTVGFSFEGVYTDYQEFLQNGLGLGLVDRIVYLLKALIFPIALVLICQYYKKSHLIIILFFGPMILLSLARGTDKETFDLVLILAIISYYYGISNRTKLIILTFVVVVLYVFVLRKFGRFGNVMPDCLPDSSTCFNFESYLARVSPLLEIGFVMGCHYLTQGYEGLNLAFGLDFDFNFGVGHLPPLKSMVCGILDVGCDTVTYNDKLLATGWDTRYRWSTAYSVLANDLHWLFVPVYTFFIGWSLRLAELNWYLRRNPSALAVIVLIGIFTLYSSANMQLAVSLDWTLATVFLLYGKAVSVRTQSVELSGAT